FRLGRVEASDGCGGATQLVFVHAADREQNAREVAELLEPAAERMKKNEQLELARRRRQPPRDCADALRVVGPRRAVEVLVMRAKERLESFAQRGVHERVR